MIFDILSIVPGKKKRTMSGWYSFNAVCCHHRGHKADRRNRGGIRFDGMNWSYHCFNCNFKCGFTLGKNISKNTRQLLSWCNIEESQIAKWNIESLQNKDLLEIVSKRRQKSKIKFKETSLPDNAIKLDASNIDHKNYVDYLSSRKIDISDFTFYVTPDVTGRNKNRIIVPYTYENKNVGHISRYLDNRIPKYIKEQQPGYLFGIDQQKQEYEVCLVFEGIFDAIPFNGCAVTHDDISDEQAEILLGLNKKIIVVPDQDKTGLTLIEKALNYNFYVSLPDWGPGIKDANEAMIKYGKIPTLISILQYATNSKIKLELQRKSIARQL